jgi:hypothetical protein
VSLQNFGPAPAVRSARTQSPIWRALSFLAIVWAIAGSFWFLFRAQTWLVDQVIRTGAVPDKLTDYTVVPTDCAPVIVDLPEVGVDAASLRRARMAALNLGFYLGATTALRDRGSGENDGLRRDASALALALGAPLPELPVNKSPTYALPEFGAHVFADPQCIGALLGRIYSPQVGGLYRFGAIAGYAVIFRAGGPSGLQRLTVFVRDFQKYGAAAGLPKEVWGPFIDANADPLKAFESVNQFLITGPP